MKIEVNKKNNGSLEVVIELDSKEMESIRNQAAINLSTAKTISGFRQGKAPYDLVKKYLGASAVAEEELLLAVRKFYLLYILDNEIEVVGRPKVDLVSSDPYKFKVITELFPTVNLGKWEKVRVARKSLSVSEDKVEKLVEEIRENRASEALKDKPVARGDRIAMDFTVSVDNVVIDGGQANDYSIVVGKGQLVPGFEDNLVGLKTGEKKKFDLKFPDNYHKNLAGRLAQVAVAIKSVWERKLPEVTDDFVKSLGKFSSPQDLENKLKDNLLEEAKVEEENRVEREMFEGLLASSSFSDIPEDLIKNEVEQMIAEFSHGITHQGVPFEEYLQSLKKTVDDLRKEFVEPAIKRVKVALIIQTVGKQQKLEASDEEVQEDINKALAYHNYDEEIRSRVATADYRARVKSFLTNKKVVDWLKNKLVRPIS